MPTEHIIQEGESTISVSAEYGHFAPTVWNDPANAGLKQRRKDMNVLLPGDKLVIPDNRRKEVTKPSDQKHRFQRKGILAKFRLQLFEGERPRAEQNFRLVVDGAIHTGKTDGQGLLDVFIPPDARRGELLIGPDDLLLRIDFGQLAPVTERRGLRHRLNNLGFACPEGDQPLDDETRDALKGFQKRFGLPVNGEPDAATQEKLDTIHASQTTLPAPPA